MNPLRDYRLLLALSVSPSAAATTQLGEDPRGHLQKGHHGEVAA